MAAPESDTLIGRVGVSVQEVPARGTLSDVQVGTLLRAIRPSRVLTANGHSHVSQQDIRAHLIRTLGFGGFDVEVKETECLFESEGRGEKNGRTWPTWTVAYRALVRLTIRNPHGELVAIYEDGSTAEAKNQPSRGDAHDLAYKSAISLSLKRAATSLGDQFGLSLYNKGQMEALVIQTLVPGYTTLAEGQAPTAPDLQEGVPEQVALGNDEVDVALDAAEAGAVYAGAPDVTVDETTGEVQDEAWYLQAVENATDPEALRGHWESARAAGVLSQSVKNAIMEKKAILDHEAAAAPAPSEPQPEPEPTPEPAAPDTKAPAAKKGAAK